MSLLLTLTKRFFRPCNRGVLMPLLLLLAGQASLHAQFTGGNGRGDVSATALGLTIAPCPVFDSITVTPGNTVCLGTPVTLQLTGADVLVWSGDPLNTNSGPTVQPIIQQAGTYFYQVIASVNNCGSDTLTTTITVLPIPPVEITNPSADTTICGPQPVTLTATGASSYAWTGPQLSSTTGSTVTANLTTTGTKTYTVVGTTNGCSSPAQQVIITVKAVPSVTINPPSPGEICALDTLTLSASGNAVSYTWTGEGLLATAGASVKAVPSATGSQTYTVFGTTDGCNSPVQQASVNVKPLPDVTLTPSSDTICDQQSLTLTASGADGYAWTGQGIDGSGNQVTATPGSPGSYPYSVTGTTDGCSASEETTITVISAPDITAQGSVAELCLGDTLTLSVSGFEQASWTGPGLLSASGPSVQAAPTGAGTASYLVTAGVPGCQDVDTVTVEVLPGLEAPIIEITDNSGPIPVEAGSVCQGSEIVLSTAEAYTSYQWNTGATTETITLSPSSGQTWSLEVENEHGCSAEGERYIAVIPIASSTLDTTLKAGQFLFINDKTFSESNPVDSLLLPGASYTGCDSVLYVHITYLTGGEEIFDGFSPNNDGVNEVFEIPENDLNTYTNSRLLVFNRWGDVVYDKQPYLNNWDGTLLGQPDQPLPAGTYYYILWLKKTPDETTAPIEKEVIIVR